MSMKRFVALGLACFSLACCLGISQAWGQSHASASATDPLSHANPLPADLEATVQSFRGSMETNGYAVARGYWTLWGIEDCKYPIQTLGYCYGNNPTAPYALAVIPPWKDEYVEQKFHHLLNEPRRNMVSEYRLSPREALVIFAQMPPEARYFGLQTNVFTREVAFNPNEPLYQALVAKNFDPQLLAILYGGSPDPARRMLVSSIGNSTNNVVMQNQMGHAPWGRYAYFVITSDADLAANMTDALVSAGAAPDSIFTEPVSPDLVRVGLNASADDLITYIRYSLPVDLTAGEKWRHDLPLTILRVRDVSTKEYDNPLPIPTYTERQANYDENQLSTDLGKIVDSVLTKWGQTAVTPVPFFSAYTYLDLVGQHCLGYPNPDRGPMDCLGDSQDADYQISGSAQIDNGQIVAVAGVLSTETGNATYTSLSVNWFPELVGIKNIDDLQLKGTAASYASGIQHDAGLFYVYYVARDCTGIPNCVSIPTNLLPKGATLKFIQRNYVNPGSTNGPKPDEILNPVLIVLDGHNRPQL